MNLLGGNKPDKKISRLSIFRLRYIMVFLKEVSKTMKNLSEKMVSRHYLYAKQPSFCCVDSSCIRNITCNVMILSNESASHCFTLPSLPQVKNWCVRGTNWSPVTESSWANRLRWQSPKSRPQILTFRSAEPVAMREESELISIQSTGSLWPYSEMKNCNRSQCSEIL